MEEPSLNTSGQNLPTKDHEMALCVVLLLMDHFGVDLAGLVLLADVNIQYCVLKGSSSSFTY